MRKIRAGRRRSEVIHTSLRAATLAAAILASPWLIAGAARLNATLESSLGWAMGQAGAWVMGALAVLVVLATHVRSRR
jgi:hypothetical protein